MPASVRGDAARSGARASALAAVRHPSAGSALTSAGESSSAAATVAIFARRGVTSPFPSGCT